MLLTGLLSVINELDERVVICLKLLTALGGLLLLWRSWRFHISPALSPAEPRELPYWIPFIGHARSFFLDSEGLLTYGRHFFHNTREIFSITVAGQKMYIVTSPKDISAVYKKFQTLTFDGFVKDMYIAFGMSPDGVAKMFEPIGPKDERAMDLNNKQRAHLGTGVQREQLHPGKQLDELIAIYLKHVDQQINKDSIPRGCVVQASTEGRVLSLRKWCADVLSPATVEALFGPHLLGLDSRLLDDYYTFDTHSWKLLYQYPRAFAKPMYKAMDRGTDAFTQYFQLPAEYRNQACHYIKTVEAKQRKAGVKDRDIAIAAQTLFWAANANNSKICFWLVSHILNDPVLLEAIRKELAPAISHQKLDIKYLVDQCPLLDASFNEILRLTTGASSARNVDETTTIGDKTLFVGAKVLVPYRQLHYNEEFFGPEIGTFNPYRFLDNKDLHKSQYFKPFGGGMTHCSGRFLARREVMALAAVMLTQYELELYNNKQGLPKLDLTKPTVGVMDPVGENDVLVRIRA